MRETEANAAKIAAIFNDASAVLDAAVLIEAGANPYYAWMQVRGVDFHTLSYELDYGSRTEVDNWPSGLPRPSATLQLEDVLVGKGAPDARTVFEFCRVLGITPDQLCPKSKSPREAGYCAAPAPSEIVEAATHFMVDMRMTGRHGDVADFLAAECRKADLLGDARIGPDMPVHMEMLSDAERAYEAHIAENPDEIRDDSPSTVMENEEPIEDIRLSMHQCCDMFERILKDEAKDAARDMAVHKKAEGKALKTLYACVSGLAPTGKSADWLRAFNKAKAKHGLPKASQMLLDKPEVFHELRPFWRNSASAALPDGKYVTGFAVLSTFVAAYADYAKERAAYTKAEGEMEGAIDELMDFRSWRKRPETETFLTAEAHRRHILGNLDREELGFIAAPPFAQLALPPYRAPALLPPPKSAPN